MLKVECAVCGKVYHAVQMFPVELENGIFLVCFDCYVKGVGKHV